MMNRRKLMRRLSVVAALVAVLAVAAGTPVLQAQPEAGTIDIGDDAKVWNGHNCPINVTIGIDGLSAGLGGYETKVGWDAARFSSANADVSINIGTYLTNGGIRQQTGESGTPPLKAVSSGAVKFGAYSWGANNPAGNTDSGPLATVALMPTATCGDDTLRLTETQLVDVNGAVIDLTGQDGSDVTVLGRYNIDADAIPVVMPFDVLAVVGKVGQPTSNSCGTGYQYNVDGDAIPVVMPFDVLAVVAKVGQTTCQ